jgi:hypothetical protein
MSVFNLAQKRSFPPLCRGTKVDVLLDSHKLMMTPNQMPEDLR